MGVLALCARGAGGAVSSVLALPVTQIAAARAAVTTIAFSPDGQRIGFGTADDQMHLWTLGETEAIARPDGGSLVAFVRRKAGAAWRLLTLGASGTVNLYDPQTLRRDDWISQRGGVGAVASTPCLLVTTDAALEQPIRLYPLGAEMPSEKAATLPRLTGLVGRVDALVTNADASRLVLAGTLPAAGRDAPSEGFVVIWNRRENGRPQVHTIDSAVVGAAISPDGARIATVGYEGDADLQTGRIRVWDAATGRALITYPPQTRGVRSVAFAPDARLLATGGGDGVLRLWNAESGRMRVQGKVDGAVTALCFSPKGDRLAVGTEDGVLRVYDTGGLAP